MQKIAKMGFVLLATLTLGTVKFTTASAASWHKGIPKKLQGSWLQKTGKYRYYCIISKNQVHFIANGHGSGGRYKVQTKYVGNNTWRYRQKNPFNGSNDWEYGKLHYMNSRHKLRTNGTTFHKVSKVTFPD